MVTVRSPGEIEIIARAGAIVGEILDLADHGLIAAGVETSAIDARVDELIRTRGGIPAFNGYRGFPASTCISINDQVVHGIPGPRRVKQGDLVSLDVGVKLDGYYADGATTVLVGSVSRNVRHLVETCRLALARGIAAARCGARVIDISRTIQNTAVTEGFSVVRKYVGHGIGREMHEEPQIPNYVDQSSASIVLDEGMVLAIEPMINAGKSGVRVLDDGWTAVTADGSASAHFEHTVVVTPEGGRILTSCPACVQVAGRSAGIGENG
jgi:methionyl aminopeptidase